MTERLEEILKESPFNQHTEEFLIKLEDMNEITKIVQELEELNRILSSDKSMFIEELVREQHQNKRYREVLEFYADEENYEFETIVSDCDIEVVSKVLDDYGQKARKVLEESE